MTRNFEFYKGMKFVGIANNFMLWNKHFFTINSVAEILGEKFFTTWKTFLLLYMQFVHRQISMFGLIIVNFNMD